MTKEEILEKIEKYDFKGNFGEIPKEFMKDIDIANALAEKNGGFINLMDESFRKNKDIMLKACKSNKFAIKYVDDSLYDDKEVVLLVLESNPNLLWKVSNRLLDDEDVITTAVFKEPETIKYASDRIKNDSNFMKKVDKIKSKLHLIKQKEQEEYRNELLTKIEEYKNKTIWWNDVKVNYEKLDEKMTDEMVMRIEQKYNKKLPTEYIELLKQQNGGRLIKRYILKENKRIIEVDSILGITSRETNKTSLEYETDVLREEINDWELMSINPENVIVFGKDESGGHAHFIFDYTELNENGEPKISYFDNELDEKEIILDSFADFVSKLRIKEEIDYYFTELNNNEN